MATDRHPISDNPDALNELLDNVSQQKSQQDGKHASGDAILFSGNRQETVPRALFFDRRLTPLERNAWQVLRFLLNPDALTAFPTYEQLRPYLAAMPCTGKASHETVARALILLRLTRWLSLVRRRRNAQSGRIQGNLYVLHDVSLSLFEAIQLDADYLDLVSQALVHASKAIQRVGEYAVQEIAEDPLLKDRTLPTRLRVLAERLASQSWRSPKSYPQADAIHNSEEGVSDLLRNCEVPSSDSEEGDEPSKLGFLRNPKKERIVRSSNSIYKVRTIRRLAENLHIPDYFSTLQDKQRQAALAALGQVDQQLQQAVLNEWTVRCMSGDVRNPAGYLFGIIQKAIRGEFNTSVGELLAHTHTSPGPEDKADNGEPDHGAQLRSILDRF